MAELSDYIEYAKSHRRDSAKFLTTFEGKDIYAGIFLNKGPRFIGFPLLMTESQGKVTALAHHEILKVLASLPDEE